MRATLTDGDKTGAVDFLIGGDLNIELRLGTTEGVFKAWTVSNGTGCSGLSVDEAVRIQSPLKKLRWLQL